MANVIDLTAEPEHAILHSTEAGGILGGSYLSEDSLQQYLLEREAPKYVLRSKKAGLTVEGADNRTLKPDSEYQMLALVTDLRIEFVAGKAGGDESMTLLLADVVATEVDSGLRTSTLTVETLTNERWSVSCRGDLSPVATYIEEAAQAWANAGRLLDELEDSLGVAQDYLAEGEYTAASEEIDGAEERIGTAKQRISELGAAATAQVTRRGETLREWVVDIQRELLAGRAARAHASAQDHWQEKEYEAAASAYEHALNSYRRALETDGTVPADDVLESRSRAATGEQELLRVGPLVDADTSRRRAKALADPEDAAAEWESALDGYRELLGLDWGAEEPGFVADRELLREQTVEIADDAISDHLEAGRRWLRSGDKLAVQERTQQAEQVYERATHQFEQARRLASEVQPERIDETETALDAADRRRDGEMPTETVPEDPFSFDPVSEVEDEESEVADGESADGIEGLSFHDSGSVTARTPGETPEPETERGGDGRGGPSASVLDSIQAQKQASVDASGADRSTERQERSDTEELEYTDTAPEATSETEHAPEGDSDRASEDVATQVDSFDAAEFTELVATLWEESGWMTTVFGEAVYDIVAMRENPDERLLLWTSNAESEVTKTTIKQCATTLESSQGSDGAVLVTADSLTRTAANLAEELGVTVVERDELVDRLDAAGLLMLPDKNS